MNLRFVACISPALLLSNRLGENSSHGRTQKEIFSSFGMTDA